jgi:hypothetical protein
MKYWVGIDPGASGALCILYEDNTLEFVDFKSTGLKGYIHRLVSEIATPMGIDKLPHMTAIEKVHSMPGQGVKSVFSFGQRLGELEGMLQTLDIGYDQVRPMAWQKACGVKPKSGKKGVHEVMSKIYPKAELLGPQGGIKDGRCDALGIAHALRKTYP